ncbi:MAG: hypothetical protein V4665_03405 [Patescibacteria group bacterium]
MAYKTETKQKEGLMNKRASFKRGYAILFTVVVVSVISLIAFGISNTTFKQIILSSLAKDSEIAFYQADTAVECALYADGVINMFSVLTTPPAQWNCGIAAVSGNKYSLQVKTVTPGSEYEIEPTSPGTLPCFEISVQKTVPSDPADPVFTKTKGRGYNNCDKTNARTVQREIEINY